MSKFQIVTSPSQSPTSTPAFSRTSTTYSDEYNSEDDLPYPTELPRSDFLAPDFNPSHYLSTLRDRHQTLEDLRSDLRQRSQLLSKELVDLVNGHYEEFLSLGADLKGGEEKVEGVRVGLLGFRREVEGVRERVEERRREVGGLLAEKRGIREDVAVGRALLELERGLGKLEGRLGIRMEEVAEEEDALDYEDVMGQNGSQETTAVRRLQAFVRQYVLLTRLIARVGPQHPFLLAQSSRMENVRKAVLADMGSALRQAKNTGDQDAVLAIVRLYGVMGAERDGVRTVKNNG